MNTNQETVRQADELLRKHRLFQDGKVQNLWNQVEWTESDAHGSSDAQFISTSETPTITLYHRLAEQREPELCILREFGLLIQSKGGPRAQTIWDEKLDLPTPDDVNAAVAVLSTRTAGETGERRGNYKELLSRYPDKGSAVPRLVFINIANALLANNVPYRDSDGVDIRAWGPTTEYCSFKRYHSLIPLTSAYCPAEVHRCFGIAFSRYVFDDLACCTESSTAAGLRRIILNVVSRLHPLPPLPRH